MGRVQRLPCPAADIGARRAGDVGLDLAAVRLSAGHARGRAADNVGGGVVAGRGGGVAVRGRRIGDRAVGAVVADRARRDVAVELPVYVRRLDRRRIEAMLLLLDHILDDRQIDLVGRRLELPGERLAVIIGEGLIRRNQEDGKYRCSC